MIFSKPLYYITKVKDHKVNKERILSHISKSNYELNLLDLACGNGRNSMYAASIGYKVTSVDINKNTLSEMQQKYILRTYFLVKSIL